MLGPQTKKRQDSSVDRWEDLSPELWEVQVGNGPSQLLTLDELDLAFKNDEITAHTLAKRPGTAVWKSLGEIAGIAPSALTLESESLVPVASDVALPEIPRPPPLPREAAGRTPASISVAAPRPRRIGRAVAGIGALAVIAAGVFAFGSAADFGGHHAQTANALIADAPIDLPAPVVPPPAPMVPAALIEQGAIVILAPGARTDEPAKAAAKSPAKKGQKAPIKAADTAKSAKKAPVVSAAKPIPWSTRR